VAPGNIPTYEVDPRWLSIDLLSDVHLCADMPRTFDVWARHLLETPADAVLMLGDLFELWVGDDTRHQGFERECADVLRAASARRTLAFMPGNRDFLVGQDMLEHCGVRGLTDPTVLSAWGRRFLLTHGDALCLADQAYQRFRTQVRDPAWQQRFLAQPLSQRQSQARAMRQASEAHQSGMSPDLSTDVDEAAALAWLQAADATVMVHGHTHRPAVHALPDGAVRHVMGDWDLDGRAPRARALRLTADGLQTLDLAAPQ
jgi:UDP-2,3-diacylglucosamine hydrolase